MREHVRLGRIAGIPVGMNLSVLVILVLIADGLAVGVLPATVKDRSTLAYWVTGVIVALLFMAALLAHEVAHAVVARRRGVRVDGITLWMLGGVTRLENEAPGAKAELVIALAGPLTSVAAAGLFGAVAFVADVASAPELLTAGVAWLGGTNLLLAVFNLLPGAPLDGGRVLKAALWLRWGDRTRAAVASSRAGLVLGGLLITGGLFELLFTTAPTGGLWLMLLGWFLSSSARAEERSAVQQDLLAGLTVADVMSTDVTPLPGYLLVEAVLERVRTAGAEVFTVVDLDGRVTGLLTLDDLLRLPAAERSGRRLSDLATPTARLVLARSSAPLAEVVAGWPGDHPVLVVDGDDAVGVVTVEDVRHALRRVAATREPLVRH